MLTAAGPTHIGFEQPYSSSISTLHATLDEKRASIQVTACEHGESADQSAYYILTVKEARQLGMWLCHHAAEAEPKGIREKIRNFWPRPSIGRTW